MTNDKAQQFAHLAWQILASRQQDAPYGTLQDAIALGLYDVVAQTLAQVAPAFGQAGHGQVNIEWETIMSVIDIPALREGWDKI